MYFDTYFLIPKIPDIAKLLLLSVFHIYNGDQWVIYNTLFRTFSPSALSRAMRAVLFLLFSLWLTLALP